MENIIKIILLILGGILVITLAVFLLPILILAYIFIPKRPAKSWFNTFRQQTRAKEAESTESNYYSEIPASEDVIDVSADEIEDKK
ncbi:MAG: hypothetical protein KAS17_09925 [Victivallaceae bacterium]|nr:hypothetical protein [Victivallaceae bacterium]